MADLEIKYLRKRNDPHVYPATQILIDRGDMYPCDVKGKFVSTATDSLDMPAPTAKEEPAQTQQEEQDETVLLAMIARAKELGIKSPHMMKEATLAARIADAEEALATNKED